MKSSLVFALLAGLILSSCTHYYYVPNMLNVPLFKDKLELHASGNLGSGESSSSTEIQTAFSFTNNVGITLNQMSVKYNDNSELNTVKAGYFEGGLGYFRRFGGIGEFEIFGGYGGGSQEHTYGRSFFDLWTFTSTRTKTGSSSLKFSKLYLQPSVGISLKNLDLAFSMRFSKLSFKNIDNRINKTLDEIEFKHLNDIVEGTYYYFIEPSFTLRGGIKNVKLQLQITPGLKTNPDLLFENTHVGFGIFFVLPLNEQKND